ncbi:MAG: DtxR family transcriptional regulator, partial [Meiothermus sp.]
QDQDALNLLARLGIRPGVRVEMLILGHGVEGTRVRIGKERYLLPSNLADLVWVSQNSV